jgi:hypothetical protein
VYAVLESKLNTDQGKSIIQKYETSFVAQSAYNDLHKYHSESTKAMIDPSTIQAYVTSSKIRNG